MNENLFKLKSETNRLIQHCDDLNAGKKVTVFTSELSQELHAEIKFGKLISQMNDTKLQIKQHVNVFKEKYPSLIARFEEDINFVESNVLFVSSHIPFVEAYEQMQMMSIKLESIERNFANSIEHCINTTKTKNQLRKKIKKIENQKLEIFKRSFIQFKNEFKADFDYAESIQLPNITDTMSQSDLERSLENAKLIHTRLNRFLSKLGDRLYSEKSQLSTDVAGSTISFQSEKFSQLQDQPILIEGSKPIAYDDLSTQTDFTPRITRKAFRRYDRIRYNSPDPQSHLSELQNLFESTKQNNEIEFNVNQKNIDCLFEDFKLKARKNMAKIKLEVHECSHFYWWIKCFRKRVLFSNTAELVAAVKSQFNDSSIGVFLLIELR